MKEENEKGEMETHRRLKNVTNKNPSGVSGKLRLEDVSLKVCQWDW